MFCTICEYMHFYFLYELKSYVWLNMRKEYIYMYMYIHLTSITKYSVLFERILP